MEITYRLEDIGGAAAQLAAHLNGHRVIAFHGDMGAGKTTFIQALCKQLGVMDTMSSPTFSIINRYSTDKDNVIFHIDLYRLKDDEEAINAGVEECIYSGCSCFIEWPEKISFLPVNTLHVHITPINETERHLAYKLPS